jgi:metal-responsive CopG/Arc/MetJ family transcriptional regulator
MREIISFTIKRELRENIDDIRGDVPRSKYINRVLEQSVTELKNKNHEKENKMPADNSLTTGYQQAVIARGEN